MYSSDTAFGGGKYHYLQGFLQGFEKAKVTNESRIDAKGPVKQPEDDSMWH